MTEPGFENRKANNKITDNDNDKFAIRNKVSETKINYNDKIGSGVKKERKNNLIQDQSTSKSDKVSERTTPINFPLLTRELSSFNKKKLINPSKSFNLENFKKQNIVTDRDKAKMQQINKLNDDLIDNLDLNMENDYLHRYRKKVRKLNKKLVKSNNLETKLKESVTILTKELIKNEFKLVQLHANLSIKEEKLDKLNNFNNFLIDTLACKESDNLTLQKNLINHLSNERQERFKQSKIVKQNRKVAELKPSKIESTNLTSANQTPELFNARQNETNEQQLTRKEIDSIQKTLLSKISEYSENLTNLDHNLKSLDFWKNDNNNKISNIDIESNFVTSLKDKIIKYEETLTKINETYENRLKSQQQVVQDLTKKNHKLNEQLNAQNEKFIKEKIGYRNIVLESKDMLKKSNVGLQKFSDQIRDLKSQNANLINQLAQSKLHTQNNTGSQINNNSQNDNNNKQVQTPTYENIKFQEWNQKNDENKYYIVASLQNQISQLMLELSILKTTSSKYFEGMQNENRTKMQLSQELIAEKEENAKLKRTIEKLTFSQEASANMKENNESINGSNGPVISVKFLNDLNERHSIEITTLIESFKNTIEKFKSDYNNINLIENITVDFINKEIISGWDVFLEKVKETLYIVLKSPSTEKALDGNMQKFEKVFASIFHTLEEIFKSRISSQLLTKKTKGAVVDNKCGRLSQMKSFSVPPTMPEFQPLDNRNLRALKQSFMPAVPTSMPNRNANFSGNIQNAPLPLVQSAPLTNNTYNANFSAINGNSAYQLGSRNFASPFNDMYSNNSVSNANIAVEQRPSNNLLNHQNNQNNQNIPNSHSFGANQSQSFNANVNLPSLPVSAPHIMESAVNSFVLQNNIPYKTQSSVFQTPISHGKQYTNDNTYRGSSESSLVPKLNSMRAYAGNLGPKNLEIKSPPNTYGNVVSTGTSFFQLKPHNNIPGTSDIWGKDVIANNTFKGIAGKRSVTVSKVNEVFNAAPAVVHRQDPTNKKTLLDTSRSQTIDNSVLTPRAQSLITQASIDATTKNSISAVQSQSSPFSNVTQKEQNINSNKRISMTDDSTQHNGPNSGNCAVNLHVTMPHSGSEVNTSSGASASNVPNNDVSGTNTIITPLNADYNSVIEITSNNVPDLNRQGNLQNALVEQSKSKSLSYDATMDKVKDSSNKDIKVQKEAINASVAKTKQELNKSLTEGKIDNHAITMKKNDSPLVLQSASESSAVGSVQSSSNFSLNTNNTILERDGNAMSSRTQNIDADPTENTSFNTTSKQSSPEALVHEVGMNSNQDQNGTLEHEPIINLDAEDNMEIDSVDTVQDNNIKEHDKPTKAQEKNIANGGNVLAENTSKCDASNVDITLPSASEIIASAYQPSQVSDSNSGNVSKIPKNNQSENATIVTEPGNQEISSLHNDASKSFESSLKSIPFEAGQGVDQIKSRSHESVKKVFNSLKNPNQRHLSRANSAEITNVRENPFSLASYRTRSQPVTPKDFKVTKPNNHNTQTQSWESSFNSNRSRKSEKPFKIIPHPNYAKGP